MEHSRTYYAKNNIIFGTVNKLATIVLQFVIRTIIIQTLGAEYLGIGSLFSSIIQALSMTELGFSAAIVFKMYKPFAEKDEPKICALLAFYKKVYTIIGFIVLGIGFVILPFLKFLINGDCPSDSNIYFLYLIYLAGTIISYFGVAYKTSLLEVAQRRDILSIIDTILIIVRSIFQIVFLYLAKNYYWYIIWQPVIILANNLMVAIISKKLFPEYKCYGKLPKEEAKDIITQVKGLAISKIGVVSRNSFDSIALSMCSGLIAVSIYSNYYYVFTGVAAFLGVITLGITGGIGNSIATESTEKNYSDFLKLNFYYSYITAWCTVCLFCLYQPFMQLWVGQDLTASNLTRSLFCVYFFISEIGQIRSIYGNVSGIWWNLRYFQIVEMILNPILNFTLGYKFGMNGIIIATIFSVTILSIIGIGWKTVVFCFKRAPLQYFVLIASYALITFLACIGTGYLCSLFRYEGIIKLLINGIICIIVPNLFFLVLVFIDPMHRGFAKSAKNLFKRNR